MQRRPAHAAALLLTVAACSTVDRYVPSTAAETVQQHAYAVFGTYAAVVEAAANIAESPETPFEVVEATARVAFAARPVMKTMLEAVVAVERARQAVTAEEQGAAERLDSTLVELERAVRRARPVLNELLSLVAGRMSL